jgi:hypothetical protein
MNKQDYVHRAKVSPAGIFKFPMDVVEATYIGMTEKVAILEAWEADERALLRAEDEGMSGGEHAHLQKVQEALDRLKTLGDREGSLSIPPGSHDVSPTRAGARL